MKGQALTIIGLVLILLFSILFIISIYAIVYYARLLVVILAGFLTFIYTYNYLHDQHVHKWINFGLSFLISSAVIVWIYQSWLYISFVLIVLGIVYYLYRYRGINIVKMAIDKIERDFRRRDVGGA